MKIKLLLYMSYILAYLLLRQYKYGSYNNLSDIISYLDKDTCPLGERYRIQDYNGVPEALIKKQCNGTYTLYKFYPNVGDYCRIDFTKDKNQLQQFLMKYIWTIHRWIIIFNAVESLRSQLKERM